jgi:hypothetical protein
MTDRWDGYPENRERGGWHWLQHNEDDPESREWSTLFGEWWLGGDEDYGGGWQSANYVGRNYTYLGPCLLPAEVAERVKDAEAEFDRLRSGLLMAMQYENKCDQTGQPCGETERCSCFLQANVWCNSTKESRHD